MLDPRAEAEAWMAEVKQNAHASLALAGIDAGFDLEPDSDDEAIFETGVIAGFTETLRLLMRRGLLPAPTEEPTDG